MQVGVYIYIYTTSLKKTRPLWVLERQINWLQNASNQGWLSLLDKMLSPLETFPCVFKEIGKGVHTGQSREM